jgi:mannose-1-phosphate guanylyltransferase/phosphomannomutase
VAQHGDTAFASDGAGGYCWPEFGIAFDAVFTAAKVLELMATSGRRLRDLRQQVPAVGYGRQTEFCPWDVKGRVMRSVMERHLNDRVDLTDGVKVFVDGGWVLVVPDADRPEYHIIASTREPDMVGRLVDEHVALVRDAVSEVRPHGAVVEKE